MGSLGLLVEACKTCDDSYSENDDEIDEEDQQNSNSYILYCKARRMPLDHVKENAILIFSSGEERAHGAELKCSHPVCREKGIKFRYCAPCQKAVAKRNFRKRHAHPEQTLKSYDSNKRKQLQPIFPENIQNNHHVAITTKHREENIQTETLGQNDSGCFINESYRPSFYLMPPNSVNHQHDNNNTNERLRSTIMYVPQPWIDLFHERPRDGDKDQIKMWLVRAMSIAELSTNNVQHPNFSNSLNTESEYFPYDPVTAVREEFTGIVPPRYMNFEKMEQHPNSNSANFRDHADIMPLHIKTELDDSCSIMLDSKGSIMTTTPNDS